MRLLRIVYRLSFLVIAACTAASSFDQDKISQLYRNDQDKISQLYRKDQDATSVVYQPTGSVSFGDLPKYARIVRLFDEPQTLLTTFQGRDEDGSTVFPIYRSTDNGRTWNKYSKVTDTNHGWGMTFDPQIWEFPDDFGEFKKGTLLVAGIAAPPDDLRSASLDVYFSRDKGATWTYAAMIASMPFIPRDGRDPYRQPFFLMHEGTLICFYTDRSDDYALQKIVYRATNDLYFWGARSGEVIATGSANDFPSNAVVTRFGKDERKFMLVYESCCDVEPASRIRYRIAGDPFSFHDAPDQDLVTDKGMIPTHTPYVTYTSAFNGLLILSSGSDTGLYLNYGQGDAGLWVYRSTNAPQATSRSLLVSDDPRSIFIAGADVDGKVTVTLHTFD